MVAGVLCLVKGAKPQIGNGGRLPGMCGANSTCPYRHHSADRRGDAGDHQPGIPPKDNFLTSWAFLDGVDGFHASLQMAYCDPG